MEEQPIRNYQAFWPYYVNQHKNKTNRNLHFLGTSLAIFFCLLTVVWRDPSFLIFAPIFGYGFAWFGHFYHEKNRPATFKYILWSLRGDFQMYFLMCVGRMDREVQRMNVLAKES